MAENDKSPNRKDNLGRFAGIYKNKGDALTFWIWIDNTQEIILRSIVCSVDDPSNPNERITACHREDYYSSSRKGDNLHSFAEVVDVTERKLHQVDPMEIIGRKFFSKMMLTVWFTTLRLCGQLIWWVGRCSSIWFVLVMV